MTILEDPGQAVRGTTLALFDDNVGRGGQAATVLAQWFGRPSSEWQVPESHVQALSPEVQAVFRSCSIRFVFVTGYRRGLETLRKAASELLGDGDVDGVIVVPTDIGCFRPAARIFDSPAELERTRAAFKKAGRLALADRVAEWGQEKVNERLLGYGNLEGLAVFPYNVPTSTLTALWKDCGLPGQEWKALFPRRSRK